jgi:hypothetical protein
MNTRFKTYRPALLKVTGFTLAASLLAACATPPPPVALSPDTLVVLTQKLELLTLNAAQPEKVLQRTAVTGLPAGESLVGIDFRVARGVLFGLSNTGRLYTLDLPSGAAKAVGSGPGVALQGQRFGVDFNPVADRVRVVSDTGQNLRLHPDTGALAATDPEVSYAQSDKQALQKPELAGAAYTYNKRDDTLTTNYVIDQKSGTLVAQGSVEGLQPVVSPNTGLLRTVGPLGTGGLQEVAFDIADVSGTAYAALRGTSASATQLYTVNLSTGLATLVGTVGDGSALLGLTVQP